jgi:hypothetical protein
VDEPTEESGKGCTGKSQAAVELKGEMIEMIEMCESREHCKYSHGLAEIHRLTRVNSTNVLDEGLRIGEIGRRMNSKVRLVEIGVYRK